LHLIVSGRVQGVFFRQSAMNKARGLGLTGWVRNRVNGSVEIVAEGHGEDLKALLAWAHHGPPAARVDRVAAEWSRFTNEFTGFRVR
ncbi:MAG: acylphosphatase, partial [Candidatus Binataceae bacterium]